MNARYALPAVFAAVLLLLSPGMPAAGAEEETSAADTAWKAVRKAATAPSPPKEWFTTTPSDEELNAFNKVRAGKALTAADQAKEFYTHYPESPHAHEARLLEYHLLTAVQQLGDKSVGDRMFALQAKLSEDPTISEDDRLEMVLTAAKSALQGAGDDPGPALLKAKSAFLKAYEMFPKRAEPAAYLLQLADMMLVYDQADPARDILHRLDTEGTDENIRKTVKEQLAKFDRVGKPVEIAFTDLEGNPINLTGYKGRVVMIDYWATWCGPCVASIPEVLETYRKWHPKGFEILGISLDNDEDALKSMIKERGMTWPQFFDRGNSGNRLADQYGITGIPTVWLIDKKGNLRYLNARHDLDGKIAKLMAEQ